MRKLAVLFSLLLAWVIAIRLVGFTSAVQSQKTVLVGLVLSALFCSVTYGILRKKRMR